MTQDDLKEEFRCCECKEDLEHTQMICWTCFCRLKDKIRQEDVEEFKKRFQDYLVYCGDCYNKGVEFGKQEQKKEEREFLDNLVKRKTMTQGTLKLIFDRIEQLSDEVSNGG